MSIRTLLRVVTVFAFLLAGGFTAKSQELSVDTLLARGKAEFKKDFFAQDYAKALKYLEQAAEAAPDNPEVLYHLAYAMDRTVQRVGEDLLSVYAANTINTSVVLEKVIALSPKYKGEKIVLDTYSKLTAIWGSLALRYYFTNNTDSMRWALQEGRKRGGFRPFFLNYMKLVLDGCEPNSLLVTSGDNITFNLFYVQTLEGYRKDVVNIDVSLLYTTWYPKKLKEKKLFPITLSEWVMDSLQYLQWPSEEQIIEYGKSDEFIKWTVEPVQEGYLLRGNLMLLHILKTNKFKRPVYMTDLGKEDFLNLEQEHLYFDGILYKVVPAVGKHTAVPNAYKSMELINRMDGNCDDEVTMMETIRFNVMRLAYYLNQEGNSNDAMKLYRHIKKTMPPNQYPYPDWAKEFFSRVEAAIK